MEYPNLLITIRKSGCPQYEVAKQAGLREGRLSEIVRRGGATDEEQLSLSQALKESKDHLFGQPAEAKSGELLKKSGRTKFAEHPPRLS